MSDTEATYVALEKALRDHVAAMFDGAMLTDWVLTAASVSGFDSTNYVHCGSENSSAHARLGLALVTYRNAKDHWDCDSDDVDD